MTAPFELSLCKSIDNLTDIPAICLVDGVHDLGEWVMEPKLDGFRMQLLIEGGSVRCWTRSEKDASGKMVAAETALLDLAEALDGTVLDGEAVYVGDDGVCDFHWTASAMGSGKDVCVAKQRAEGKYVSFVAFDILQLRGLDVRHYSLGDRRTMLEAVVAQVGSDHVRITEQARPSAEQHRIFTEQYGEGSVVKSTRAPYTGGRSKVNLKWKKVLDEDVVVLGSEEGKGKFAGMVGAVVFGQKTDTPPAKHKCTALCVAGFHERGRCSGMTDDVRQQLTDNLPLGEVMVITHNGVLAAGGFRHPQFSHFRDDKAAYQCEWTN